MSPSHNLVLFFLFIPASLAQTCYAPDGQPLNHEWAPCNSNSNMQMSMCCAINRPLAFGGDRASGRASADRCLSNGLCQNNYYNSTSGDRYSVFSRNGCTIKNGDSKACMRDACKDGWFGNGASALMTPCDGTPYSTYWCCSNNTDCCGSTSQIALARVLEEEVTMNTEPSVSSATASPNSTLGDESSPTSQPSSRTLEAREKKDSLQGHTPDRRQYLSNSAIVATTVSSIVAVIALLTAFILWKKRHARRKGEGELHPVRPIGSGVYPDAGNGEVRVYEAYNSRRGNGIEAV